MFEDDEPKRVVPSNAAMKAAAIILCGIAGYKKPIPDGFQEEAARIIDREVNRYIENERVVLDAAIAYADQLGAFNNLVHEEVRNARIKLIDAVGDYHGI